MKIIERSNYFNKFEDFVLFIKVDEGCNMRCSFCYQNIDNRNTNKINEDNIKLCLENVKFAIDKYLELREKYELDFSYLTVCFFGGEPTLNTLAIHQICDFIKNKYTKEQLKNIRLSITTNGTNYNDEVVAVLNKMKSVSENTIGMLISSDNNKEVYDKNRKLLYGEISTFEIVKDNIEKFKTLLREINGMDSDDFVQVSSVLATEEQIIKSKELIQENYKSIYRGEKFLYGTNNVSKEYIEQSKEYLSQLYNKIIDDTTIIKDDYIGRILDVIFDIKDESSIFGECKAITTIYGDGTFGWCNKHKYFENETYSNEKMKELVFNIETDNSHFKCVKAKIERGSETKDVVRKNEKLWERFVSRYTLSYHMDGLNVFYKGTNNTNLYNFIKYGLLACNSENITLYIEKPSQKIIHLCKEHGVILTSKPIKPVNTEIINYIDENGYIYFDETSPEPVSNINDKYFLFYDTPILIDSINTKFNTMLGGITNGN